MNHRSLRVILAAFSSFALVLLLPACTDVGTGSGAGTISLPLPAITSIPDPIPVPAPAPASATLDAEESAFVGLINAYRAQNGLNELKVSIALTASAKWMSDDMAAHSYLDHTDSTGRDPFVRMANFGYSYNGSSGENIAAGNNTAQATFAQWKNSPAHNANMLGSSYAVMGIARANNPSSQYGWYWTNDFGSTVDTTY